MNVRKLIKIWKSEWLKEYRLIIEIWAGKFPEYMEKPQLSILEKSFMTLLVFIRSFSLVHIQGFFKSIKIRSQISEFYVIIWFFLFFVLLWYPLPLTFILYIIVLYGLIDLLNYRLCIVFVDRYQQDWGLRSLNRSLLLLMLNFFEIILGFAILYLATESIGYSNSNEAISTPIEALYFSTVTITTLGFGDIQPILKIGQKLAMLEVLSGFILVILVIGVFISGINIKEIKRKKYD